MYALILMIVHSICRSGLEDRVSKAESLSGKVKASQVSTATPNRLGGRGSGMGHGIFQHNGRQNGTARSGYLSITIAGQARCFGLLSCPGSDSSHSPACLPVPWFQPLPVPHWRDVAFSAKSLMLAAVSSKRSRFPS